MGSVKMALISNNKNVLTLESIGEVKTPERDWIKGEGKKMALVAKSMRELLGELKIRQRQAVTCIPEDEVISRLISLPPLKESEIRDALKFEAETFVPFPLDQVTIDYEIVEQDEAGRLSVFVIVSRNEVINTYVKLFKMAGVELVALESPALALRRVIGLMVTPETAVMVVDMGDKFSDIISLMKGNIYFTRAMSVGGESLTRAISINLGLDMASAEEYKKTYGMKETELEGKIKNAILPVFTSMAEEIRRAMVSFKEDNGVAITLLVLSGGGATLPGLAEDLTKILGIEVQVITPFLKVDISKLANPAIDLKTEGCRFALAVGLALREVS